MSKFIILFLLSVNFSAFAQKKLKGTFINTSIDHDDGGSSYKFFKNGSFEYFEHRSIHYSPTRGKGNYKITNKKVILKFDQFEENNAFLTTKNKDCKLNDSIKIDFYVMDYKTKGDIPFMKIIIKSKQSNKQIYQIDTSIDGKASISLPKMGKDSTVTCLIKSIWATYSDYSFDLNLKSCRDIKIELKEYKFSQAIPSGTIWELNFKKYSDKKSGNKGVILNDMIYIKRKRLKELNN